MMQRVGAAEFEKHVCAEGALCNWPEEKITTYIHQVENSIGGGRLCTACKSENPAL